jgi:hypothetical protein
MEAIQEELVRGILGVHNLLWKCFHTAGRPWAMTHSNYSSDGSQDYRGYPQEGAPSVSLRWFLIGEVPGDVQSIRGSRAGSLCGQNRSLVRAKQTI